MARRLYNSRGPGGVTVRAIEKGAGVTAPTIYWHFANTQEIIDEVVDAAFRGLQKELDASLHEREGLHRLTAICCAYRDYAFMHPHYYETMFSAPDPSKSISEHKRVGPGRQTFDTLESVVSDSIAAGLIRGISARSASFLIWSSIHGMVSLQIAGRLGLDRHSFSEFFDNSLGTVLDALGRATPHPVTCPEPRSTSRGYLDK